MVDLSRRNALQGLTMLPLAGSIGTAVRSASAQDFRVPASRTLVAFFSRTGNTRVIAGQIRRAHSADIFEIVTATPYPEDYQETVSQAQRERDSGFEPPLRETVLAIAAYSIVFLGFPIWGTTAPSVIRSFLFEPRLGGKDAGAVHHTRWVRPWQQPFGRPLACPAGTLD